MNEEKKVKECPYCGEEILEKAIRCKHCKSDLPETGEDDNTSASEITPPPPPKPPFVPPPVIDRPGMAESKSNGAGTPPGPPPVPPRENIQDGGYVYPKATVGKRILAFVIDSLIGGIPVAILIPLALIPFFTAVRSYDYYGNTFQSATNVGMIIMIVFVSLIGFGWSLFYFLLRDSFGAGQSWGKKICGLMVVNLDDNKPCSKGKSFVRNIFAWLFTAVFSWVPVLNAVAGLAEPIIALIHEKGQRVGDMVARTQVIDIELYRSH